MADTPNLDDVVVQHLRAHPRVLEALGGDPQRVRGDERQPPYPMLLVASTTAGRFGRWVARPEILVEAWGDPDGRPGKTALQQLLSVAVSAIRELPDRDYGPGEVVITSVGDNVAGGWSPDPTGQPRWVAAIVVAGHPPQNA